MRAFQYTTRAGGTLSNQRKHPVRYLTGRQRWLNTVCLLIAVYLLAVPEQLTAQGSAGRFGAADSDSSWSQQMRSMYFRHYETEDGLSNNTVICSLQDQSGFMWFGTSDALNRFDGTNFKIYRHDPTKPHSIGNGGITFLFEDNAGRLWVGTGKGGLYLFNMEMDNFYAVEALQGKYIRAMQQDADGRLWIAIGGKLFILELPSATDALLASLSELQPTIIQTPGSDVATITLDPNGSIWLGTLAGELFTVAKNTLTPKLVPASGLKGGSIERIIAIGKDSLLIGTSRKGLLAYDIKRRQLSPRLLYNKNGSSEIFVRDILEYQPGSYWAATEEGLFCYQTARGGHGPRTAQILKTHGDPYGLSDNALYSIFKDREGGIWLTSYFGGIHYLPNHHTLFEKFYPGPRTPAFKGNVIREITKDRYGRFWIGTEDAGLIQADFKHLQFKNIVPGPKGQAAHTNIHGMLFDKDRLYVGTFEHGIDVLDVSTGEFTDHFSVGDNNGLHSNFINVIHKINDHKFIVCTSRGVYYFNPQQRRFTLIEALPFDEFYSALTQDRAGRIWIGTHTHGLYYQQNGTWQKLTIRRNGEDLLQSTRILYLKTDVKDRLWICTEDGLFCVTDLHEVKIFDRQRGLPSNNVYATLMDSLGNIWVTTSNGLAKINSDGEKISVFNKADGLLNNQFNYQSAFADSDGYFYFGSVKGLIRFNPYLDTPTPFSPPLFITDFHLSNTEVDVNTPNSPLKRSITSSQQLTLTYKQTTFSLDFAALSYRAPSNLQYAYSMTGADGEWSDLNNEHRILFTDLPAGDYQLAIRSTDNAGRWIDNQKLIHITVLPPWWKSNWANFIYACLAIGLLLWGVLFNNRRHRLRHQRNMTLYSLRKEKELYQSKVDFFTHMAHEIRTPLTLIKGPMEQIQKEKDHLPHLEGYIDLMQRSTNRLLTLTQDLLDFRKIENRIMTLHPVQMELTSFVQDFIEPYQAAAENRQLQFIYHPPKNGIHVKADEKALAKMLNNLLDNALKYAEREIIFSLAFSEWKDKYVFCIKNDGHLIPKELHEKIFDPFFRWNRKKQTQGSGIGLFVVKSLAEIHGGSFTFTVTEDKFNTFTLSLPLQKNGPSPNFITQ